MTKPPFDWPEDWKQEAMIIAAMHSIWIIALVVAFAG